MKKSILILFPLLIIILYMVYSWGLGVKQEGAAKYLKQMNYQNVEFIEKDIVSTSLVFRVKDVEGKADTIYVGINRGNYTLRYNRFIP